MTRRRGGSPKAEFARRRVSRSQITCIMLSNKRHYTLQSPEAVAKIGETHGRNWPRQRGTDRSGPPGRALDTPQRFARRTKQLPNRYGCDRDLIAGTIRTMDERHLIDGRNFLRCWPGEQSPQIEQR